METQQIIWLVVYIVLGLLVYLSYGIGVGANKDFPNRDSRWGAIWTMYTISILVFIVAMSLHVFAQKTSWAAIFLMISIFFDVILSVIIGTTNMQGDYSAALGYVAIGPIVYKLLLFLFVNWDACNDGAISAGIGTSGSLKDRIAAMKAAREKQN